MSFYHSLGGVAAAVRLVVRAGRGAFAGVIALFAVSGLGVVVALLIGRGLIGELLGPAGDVRPTGAIPLLAALVVVLTVVSFAGAAASGVHRLLAERLMKLCGEAVLRAAARASLRDFDDPAFHDRLQFLQRAGASPIGIAMAIPNLAGATIASVGIAVGLAVISPWLIPITLVSSVPLWVAGRANSRDMYSFSFGNTPNDRARDNLASVVDERDSAAELRIFGLQAYVVDRWRGLYDERLREITAMVRRFLRRSAVGGLVSAAVLGGVIAVLLWLVSSHRIDVGSAATAIVAVLVLATQSQKIASSMAETLEHRLYVEEFLALDAWRSETPAGQARLEPFATLELEDVSFRYPAASSEALRSLTFRLDAGEVVAIVGQNGSGKTTLAKLLTGLYAPTTGVLSWDGKPLQARTNGLVPDGIGMVPQNFGRYWFSAADNIAVGDIERREDRDAIREAAERAGATEILERLPAGLDTPLAVELAGGVDLSLGQWQRIALARLMFRDARFVVLDEPTASLDAEAEAKLFESIGSLRHGRTVVLISHRFSTVRSADRILVLHEGELVEQGTHEELLALDGRYARMYRAQASAYVDTPA